MTLPAGMKDTVKKMHDFDPTNEAFRYARKLDGKKSTIKQGSLRDIQTMASEVETACKALGSAQNLACVHAQQIEDWVEECL